MWNNARLPQLSQLSYLLSHYLILPDKNDKDHIFLSTIYTFYPTIYIFSRIYIFLYCGRIYNYFVDNYNSFLRI